MATNGPCGAEEQATEFEPIRPLPGKSDTAPEMDADNRETLRRDRVATRSGASIL